MPSQDLVNTAAAEAAKGAPPLVVAIEAQNSGWSQADIVTALTIVYLLLQIGWLIWKWRRAAKTGEVQG